MLFILRLDLLFPVENDNTNLFLVLDSQKINKKGNKKIIEETFHNKNFNQAFAILKDSLKLDNCNQKKNKNANKKVGVKISLIKLIKELYIGKNFVLQLFFLFLKENAKKML